MTVFEASAMVQTSRRGLGAGYKTTGGKAKQSNRSIRSGSNKPGKNLGQKRFCNRKKKWEKGQQKHRRQKPRLKEIKKQTHIGKNIRKNVKRLPKRAGITVRKRVGGRDHGQEKLKTVTSPSCSRKVGLVLLWHNWEFAKY